VPVGRQDAAHPLAISVATSPVQFDRGFSLQSPYTSATPLHYVDIRKHVVLASRNAAVPDEFVAAAVAADVEPAKLRSPGGLLLRAKGDKALQAAQLELARTFYQAAIAADPNRNGVWHRMALVQLCQRDYDSAASSLKRVVTTDPALATEFIDMQTLLGAHKDAPQWAADQSIWQWLMERPASVDRLHLVAVWQGFKGNQQRACELVELSILAGSDEVRADRVRTILKGRIPASETSADDDSEPSASVLPEAASLQIPES
jgi:tetratricopeptide (TPR) repeat protein